MEWTKEKLWDLRSEVVVGSLFTNDFNNSFGIDPHSCYEFFDGYADYLSELCMEDGHDIDKYFEVVYDYDTIDNLWSWWYCIDGDPFEYVK